MAILGFRADKDPAWSWWWIAMWATTTPALLVSAFHVSLPTWIAAALIGFLFPELLSLREGDALPPLTHTLRHFVPNYVAFPFIYGSLGTVGAHWLEFDEPISVGLLMALLGWLTDHFAKTYAADDPHPDPRSLQARPAPHRRILQ